MKRLFSLLIAAFLTVSASAAPGDSTWIQAQTDAWLGTSPTNTDSLIQFPDGSKTYRKIYFIFTLGKYACPGNPQYCADWDYTVQNFLMTPNGDTLEIGRLITPYANSARMNATWKERYVFDVTDYYTVLKNNATVRTHFSGYSGGFTGTVQFLFIEGTPPRNVTGIERLWHGSFSYGGTTPIDSKITAFTKTAPANTQFTELKFNVSGHGSDNTGCSEFCKKYYQVMLDGNMIEQKDMWRDDCGRNHLYPQNGTWIFERGNWCPGDLIHTNTHKLNGVTPGTPFNIDVDFENYADNGSASYIVEGALIYYGGFNYALDASLEDVVAPNNHEMFYRENPATANPVVKVKNTGSTTITSIELEYSANGQGKEHYTWQGTLAPLEETTITLPELWELRIATGNTNSFTCRIATVNGTADGNITNDVQTTTFTAAPQWPTSFYITLKTNGSDNNGVSETNWTIYQDGNVVAQRTNNNTKATYVDTVKLGPGAYKLVVDDAGCDGINWWFYPNYPVNPGTGSILVKRTSNNALLTMPGYFNGDFGCGFTQYFSVNWPTSVEQVETDMHAEISVSPNPATDVVTVLLDGVSNTKGRLAVTDAVGRVVLTQNTTTARESINVTELANGAYSVVYTSADGTAKLQTKIVVAK